MRLTLHTDYALRTLIFVGLRAGRLASIPEIAQAFRISENHLTKVVHGLGRAGFLETLRGRGGGLRLARPAREIGLGAVVRATEEDLALVACFPGAGAQAGTPCLIAGNCELQAVLAEALAAFLAVLDRHSLADLLEPRQARLRALLGMEEAGPAAPPPPVPQKIRL
ncbi:Rrf2 family transcriptional regulator [Pseudoroseomonas sp. WGS1072]|uniref:Rrf2 family transcriptional regulator n=1 Tax=Roseomonas sp. WGS1072 TaxID=3366816 RepID=UPI003BF27950